MSGMTNAQDERGPAKAAAIWIAAVVGVPTSMVMAFAPPQSNAMLTDVQVTPPTKLMTS